MDFYYSQALAESTKKSYTLAKKRYIHFCVTHNLTPIELVLCQYVAFLAKLGLAAASIKCYLAAASIKCYLAAASIKCYLAAVRYIQTTEGGGGPNISSMPKLEMGEEDSRKGWGRASHDNQSL